MYKFTPNHGRFANAFARRFCEAAIASANPPIPPSPELIAFGGGGPNGAETSTFLSFVPALSWAIRSPPACNFRCTVFFLGLGSTTGLGAGAASGNNNAGSTPSARIFCSTAP